MINGTSNNKYLRGIPNEAEAQRKADKEEAACRRKYYGNEIIKAWVTCDDLGQEDYEKSDQSDFNDFVHNYQIYDLKIENPLDLGITMPTFKEYQAMKTAMAA